MKITKKLLITFVVILFVGIIIPNIIPTFQNTISVQAASVKISATKKTLYEKKTCTLKIKGTKKKVKWSSSKKTVATVSKKGKVTAKKAGVATITAKVGSKKYRCRITVKKAEINKKAITLYKGSSYTLKVLGATQKIKWSSSNKTVALVSSKGKVVTKKVGVATITAKMGKKKYTCKVTVKNQYIKKSKISLCPSDEYILCVYGRSNVKWLTSNRNIVTVTNKGKIKAINEGIAQVTAVYGKEKYICKVYVNSYMKMGQELFDYTDNIYYHARLGEINYKTYLSKILNYKEDFENKYTKNCIKNYWNVPGDRYYIKTIKGEKYLFNPCHGGIIEYAASELKIKNITDNTVVFDAVGYYYENIDDWIEIDGDVKETLEKNNIKYWTMTNEFVIKKEDGIWKVDKYNSLWF